MVERSALLRALCVALACAWLAAGAGLAAADDGPGRLALTLEEAIRLALDGSRSAVAAWLGREEQRLALEAAEERYEPTASIDASAGVAKEDPWEAEVSLGPSLRVPTGGSFRLSWSKPVAGEGDRSDRTTLSFSQPLLRGFSTEIDTAPLVKARMNKRINVRAFRDRIGGIVTSVIGAYRGVLRAARQVAIAREALERARTQLATNRLLIEAGRMAPRDVVQSEAEVANKEYALIDSENRLETANAGLINILDLEEGVRVELSEEAAFQPVRPDLEQSLETAFALRTDHLRADLGVEIAHLDLRLAEDAQLWDLSLDLEASRRQRSGVGGDSHETDYSGRLNLTVPLWDPGPGRALVSARNDVRRAEMDLAETRQAIRIDVRRAVRDVEVGLRQIDLAREALELAGEKLDIERRKLQEGLSSTFQLGRFEDDLVRAQNREVDAVVGYRNALTSLDRTLGTTLETWGIRIEQVAR